MRRFLRSSVTRFVLASVVVSAAFLPVSALAQRGGAMGGHAVAAPAAAPHVAMHAAAPAAHIASAPHAPAGHYVRSRSGSTVFRPATHSFAANTRVNGSRRVLSQDVPGLGFDYPHLAAVGGGRGHGRGFFPGRDRNRPFVAFFPFYGGGYLPLYDDYDDTPATDEQQAEAVEPDYYPGNYPPPPRPGDTPQGFPAPAPAPETSAAAQPERPSDQYVFVRRDGTLFFAVAYTWDAGNLRYVTSEGLRRSVAGDALDLNATQQFNEQRGLSFRVPTA